VQQRFLTLAAHISLKTSTRPLQQHTVYDEQPSADDATAGDAAAATAIKVDRRFETLDHTQTTDT
jgi:hypothetical protein